MEKVGDWVRRLAWFLAVGVVAYLGERGHDGGFIRDLWVGAKTASPFAAMIALFLLFDERRERRDAQKQCSDRTIDFIQSTNQQASSNQKVAAGLRQIADIVRAAIDARRTRTRRR